MLILAELTNKPNKFLTFLKFALKIIFYNPFYISISLVFRNILNSVLTVRAA